MRIVQGAGDPGTWRQAKVTSRVPQFIGQLFREQSTISLITPRGLPLPPLPKFPRKLEVNNRPDLPFLFYFTISTACVESFCFSLHGFCRCVILAQSLAYKPARSPASNQPCNPRLRSFLWDCIPAFPLARLSGRPLSPSSSFLCSRCRR